MASLLVPDDFRALLRAAVDCLDAPGDRLLDAEDAFHHDCGHGGRIDGASTYRFTYLTADGVHRWTVVLGERELRAIADGLQLEAEGECVEVTRARRREPSGEPLLIWGAYNGDALLVRGLDDLMTALEALHQDAAEHPRVLRMWSPGDEQLLAALWRDECALYVLESADGYATSMGDPVRADAFEVLDHDGNPLVVPGADCVPWPVACRALARFAAHGELGPELVVERRIPGQLLMHGELDREAVLANRAAPARDPRGSSLSQLVPRAAVDDLSAGIPTAITGEITTPVVRELPSVAELAAWARRLIQHLFGQGLIELGAGPGIDEISYQLSGLLQAHGEEAEHELETAEWLANELKAVRGVAKLFATGGDLQLALRRTRSPE
jgi:hypothetical protein